MLEFNYYRFTGTLKSGSYEFVCKSIGRCCLIFLLLGWTVIDSVDAHDNLDVERIRASVKKSVRLIELSSSEYLKHRACFSCHHQAMSVLALTAASDHGYSIDRKNLKDQVDRTFNHFDSYVEKYMKGEGTGGQVDTAGYGLWALHAGGVEKSETTSAVVKYLLKRDKAKPYWRRSSDRPPSESNALTTTGVALMSLDYFGQPVQKPEIEQRKLSINKWLMKEAGKLEETEEMVFALRIMAILDAETEAKKMAKRLLASQKADGGWAQTSQLQSDCYATSTVLDTLTSLGFLKTTEGAFEKGVAYLLDTQKEDGSWHVKSRSDPFQEYFESGFPHGKDQFISMTATCWAVMVLSEAAPCR